MSKDTNTFYYLTPIHGLIISKELKEEFKFYNVTFISVEKLKRIKKRFFFSHNGELKEGKFDPGFQNQKTFAVLEYYGNPAQKVRECREIIKGELNMLLSSFSGDRDYFYNTASLSNWDIGKIKDFKIIHSKLKEESFFSSYASHKAPYVLDKRWQSYNENRFFFKIKKILNKGSVSKKWQNTLKTALELVGQSNNSNILAYCFLNNMIVFELLLKKQGEKYLNVIPERLDGFFSWTKNREGLTFKNTVINKASIQELYTKRNNFVHDGKFKDITIEDLIFTDELVINILSNIAKHYKLFNSKGDLINYSNKFQAEKLLGLKHSIQPNTLSYISKKYKKESIEKLKENYH